MKDAPRPADEPAAVAEHKAVLPSGRGPLSHEVGASHAGQRTKASDKSGQYVMINTQSINSA